MPILSLAGLTPNLFLGGAVRLDDETHTRPHGSCQAVPIPSVEQYASGILLLAENCDGEGNPRKSPSSADTIRVSSL